MLPIKRENNQALYPSQISIALSAIALVLLQALLISALSSTPSYAAESQHMTKQQIKKRVDSFCKDPSTSLFENGDTSIDIKRLNYALVKRCFKKLADEDTSCPHDDDNDDFYAEYDTAYENALKHWIKRVNEKKNEGKRGTWLTERQNELTTFYNSFKKRCIPQFAKAACQFHNDNRGGSTNIGDCTTSYTNIINWCINNKTDIQTCNDKIYDTTGKKLNHCISEADSSARYCGKATITGQQFASDLKLDDVPIEMAIYSGWKIGKDSSSVYVESKDETKRIYVCD